MMFMMTSQVVCTREWDANGSSGVDELITNGFHCIYKPANTLVWGGGGGGRGALPIMAYMRKLHSKGTFLLGYRYIKGSDDHKD